MNINRLTIISFSAFFQILLLLSISGCKNEQQKPAIQEIKETKTVQVEITGCKSCHSNVKSDSQHKFSCSECHNGNIEGKDKEIAHKNLIKQPAHPDFLSQTCLKCHPDQVSNCQNSIHFTLKNKINLIRNKFGAKTELNSLIDVPTSISSNKELALADDMLRRRCLRCHVYSSGDEYPYTSRGTGCAACHMKFIDSKAVSHEIIKTPQDHQCLSCHYGNYTGADYYGSFEHDFNDEFRTPYTTREDFLRPFGVERHNLVPDIHKQKGMICVDCHSGAELMGKKTTKLSCSTCHKIQQESQDLNLELENLFYNNGQLTLVSKSTDKTFSVPQLKHPAHNQYMDTVSCQVCHAQWSFNDSSTYLLRNSSEEFDPWMYLTVQASSQIEKLLDHNINSSEAEIDPLMKDGITGIDKDGLWYKGFLQRRWEDMIIRKDIDGIYKIFRPILDLHLSAINEDEEVLFDNIHGSEITHLPYTPHTTGPAGLFYKLRFNNQKKNQEKNQKGKYTESK